MEAKFILSKRILHEQYDFFKKLGLRVSYSVKTNPLVASILFKETDSNFSIHNILDFKDVPSGKRVTFFSQAWNKQMLEEIFSKGIQSFVVDNERDLEVLLDFLKFADGKYKIDLALRMKFRENRIHTGKYFVYGMASGKVCQLLNELKDNNNIARLGIHIHRKSQNASEWNIKQDLEDAIPIEVLKIIKFVNLGGGYPVRYRTYVAPILDYITDKLEEVRNWLKSYGIETIVEPGRFIAAPCIKLEAEIIQVYGNNIVINCSLYNSQLDTLLTDIRLLVDGELEQSDNSSSESDDSEKKGEEYIIKGNTPTRDDIFRYKVKLKEAKVGDKITFLNAGAYNYTTEFCNLKKLNTIIRED
jgi:ornithine decarboxylase